MEWRKPSDRPKDFQDVLIYYITKTYKGDEYRDYGIGWCVDYEWYTYLVNEKIECVAWTPLPEPPEF